MFEKKFCTLIVRQNKVQLFIREIRFGFFIDEKCTIFSENYFRFSNRSICNGKQKEMVIKVDTETKTVPCNYVHKSLLFALLFVDSVNTRQYTFPQFLFSLTENNKRGLQG